jgi:hypothetical protein
MVFQADAQRSLLLGLMLLGLASATSAQSNGDRTTREALIDQSCREEPFRHGTWLDRTHSYINERLCEPAAWFDGFFRRPSSV